MPRTMRVPQKGGVGTGLSEATSERPGIASGSVSVNFDPARWMRFFSGGRPTSAGVRTARDLHQRLHEGEPLEGIAGVADLAVEEPREVVLDVRAGERRTAEDDRPLLREPARLQFLQVLLHDDGRFHEQARHADDVGVVLLGRRDDLGDGLLDAEVDHVVAVVGQDDVDEVLADVVHVAAHGGEDHRALARGIRLLHVRFEQRDGGLHHLGRLQHERQLHLARAEALADDLHALEQVVVDDLQSALSPPSRARSRSPSRPLRFAVDDPPLEALAHGQARRVRPRADRASGRGVDAGEQVEHDGERVVREVALGVVFATVPHEVESDLAAVVGDGCERHDLRGVDDRPSRAPLRPLRAGTPSSGHCARPGSARRRRSRHRGWCGCRGTSR